MDNEFEAWWARNVYPVRDASERHTMAHERLKIAAQMVWEAAREEPVNEAARLRQQIEEAHAQLDLLDVARVVGTYKNQPLTVAGRLERLRENLKHPTVKAFEEMDKNER